jgi:hypothetical protein
MVATMIRLAARCALALSLVIAATSPGWSAEAKPAAKPVPPISVLIAPTDFGRSFADNRKDVEEVSHAPPPSGPASSPLCGPSSPICP